MDATRGKIIVDGNTACALGAMFAGVTVVTWYPITPSSSLVESLIGHLKRYRIGPDGKVTDAKILRSIPMLDQAALDAVRQWEFLPTLMNGEAVSVVMTVTVNFTLQ